MSCNNGSCSRGGCCGQDSDSDQEYEAQSGGNRSRSSKFCQRNNGTCSRGGYCGQDDSDEEFEVCQIGGNRSALTRLPFDPTSLERIILMLSDKFDFRVVMSDERVKGAMLVTTGLSIVGGLIGKRVGGNFGAAIGGAVGGGIGLGMVVVSMRDVWQKLKAKLSELFDIVYDYLAGMGIEDYKKAARFIMDNRGDTTQLAMLVLSTTTTILGKRVLSSITAGVL